MDAADYPAGDDYRAAWQAVQIVRNVPYGLFTFGESRLDYFLILERANAEALVSVTRGQVKITRPLILTRENAPPELSNFFEDANESDALRLILSRSASFRHLRLNNEQGSQQYTSDSVEEVVDRINRDLDRDEEDRVAILTAPAPLAGLAVLKYAVERVMHSAADNIQELRERGFLP